MQNKIVSLGLAGLLIIVFIAGYTTYNTLDNRIKEINSQTSNQLIESIKTNKDQINAVLCELRAKADVALFTKYDSYFESLNKSMTDVQQRLARIEGQLSAQPK